jgi:hypothetical protein
MPTTKRSRPFAVARAYYEGDIETLRAMGKKGAETRARNRAKLKREAEQREKIAVVENQKRQAYEAEVTELFKLHCQTTHEKKVLANYALSPEVIRQDHLLPDDE